MKSLGAHAYVTSPFTLVVATANADHKELRIVVRQCLVANCDANVGLRGGKGGVANVDRYVLAANVLEERLDVDRLLGVVVAKAVGVHGGRCQAHGRVGKVGVKDIRAVSKVLVVVLCANVDVVVVRRRGRHARGKGNVSRGLWRKGGLFLHAGDGCLAHAVCGALARHLYGVAWPLFLR